MQGPADPLGVTKVVFEMSGGTLSDQVIATATPTIYGWLAQWNTTTAPNGTYTLQSVATDADNNTDTSTSDHHHVEESTAGDCGAHPLERGDTVGHDLP